MKWSECLDFKLRKTAMSPLFCSVQTWAFWSEWYQRFQTWFDRNETWKFDKSPHTLDTSLNHSCHSIAMGNNGNPKRPLLRKTKEDASQEGIGFLQEIMGRLSMTSLLLTTSNIPGFARNFSNDVLPLSATSSFSRFLRFVICLSLHILVVGFPHGFELVSALK